MKSEIRKQIEMINYAFSSTAASYEKWAKNHGLNYNSMMVLYAMEEIPNSTQKQISERCMLPKQTVNSIIFEFKNKGYVTICADSTDKREKTVHFTEAGKQYCISVLSGLYEAEEKAMQRLGANLCRQLVDSNTKFYEVFKDEVEKY